MRQDLIREPKPAHSEHYGQRYNERPASTYRCAGDPSPAANTANLFAEKVMKTKATKNVDSNGTCPIQSTDLTATRRSSKELREEFEKLIPLYPDDHCFGDADVTDEIEANLRSIRDQFVQHIHAVKEDLIESEIDLKEVESELNVFGRNRLSSDSIKLKDACPEIVPGIAWELCFSFLRSAGILSNHPEDWNQAFGEPVERGLLQNHLRWLRTDDGHLFCRSLPYASQAGLTWLKDTFREDLRRLSDSDSRPTSSQPGRAKRKK